MELSLIGLQNAGKTSLVNVVATGGYSEDMIPTVGFNMRKVTKGNVTIKLWDLGGQPRFRSMWERYCRAVSAIVYVVDAADPDNLSVSISELHDLLSKTSLNGIPLLILGNKIDKPGALSKEALTHEMELQSLTDREVCCFMISCKNSTNIDQVGFNMRKVTKGNVTIKLWDLGGQPRFRSMWERYCRAVSAIVYVVDAADPDNLSVSISELHDLLSKTSLNGIPLLILGNKIDKPGALSKEALTHEMELQSLTDREVCCFMISCKNSTNIDQVIDWLVKHSKSKN
ncbi:hypothetical protein DY000_02026391 [Brassica cretica]|uniref:ADP-ribosylation factor-like protein 8A n=1 Tax=Brassica cretica TaxID=69181 RepID=A0ABQ7E1Y5_BRACR|nr:hypothetical protein DY000_02026391 [Brassica cretica]